METIIKYHYIIIDLDNNTAIALDRNSGGYPYNTTYPGSIEYFDTYEKALKYRNMFTSKNWGIYNLEFKLGNRLS
jgi:hypothetical protein